MEITYRPARLEDLESAARLVANAYNDLRSHHGLAPTFGLRPPLFQRFCFMEKSHGFWIAEQDGQRVGFAWMRQRFWYLARLFVAPMRRVGRRERPSVTSPAAHTRVRRDRADHQKWLVPQDCA
jgi:hypothetical protein